MKNQKLNLARKWRSATFDEMIGQDLTVRIIKNSLYKDEVFPVYLLSGQRGCGKTTTGRLWAAALNCARLPDFQKDPQRVVLPCRECTSCKAMAEQAHPDFIEIDAASHTGVENVRQIIETATFLPVLGRKKVYLIDEAHMLSKAAFNAFLKILEEPPVSVIFFLATTEPTKIIDTVRSRCFQLFFNPVAIDVLAKHLALLCEQEQIRFDYHALQLIAEQADGSVRDAVNLVERIRLIDGTIMQESLQQFLGIPHDQWFIELLDALIAADIHRVLHLQHTISSTHVAPLVIWKRMVHLILQRLKQLSGTSIQENSQKLLRLLEVCYHAEGILIKSQIPSVMGELFIFKLLTAVSAPKLNSDNTIHTISKRPALASQNQTKQAIHDQKIVDSKPQRSSSLSQAHEQNGPWQLFLSELPKLEDPLISSIFVQAEFQGIDDLGVLTLKFGEGYLFFKELLESTQLQWQPLLQAAFKRMVTCKPLFEGRGKERNVQVKSQEIVPMALKKSVTVPSSSISTVAVPESERAQLLLKTFPGKVIQIKENHV